MNRNLILVDDQVCSLVGYFYKSRCILASPWGESKYKRRVKIYMPRYYTLNHLIRHLLSNMFLFKTYELFGHVPSGGGGGGAKTSTNIVGYLYSFLALFVFN